MVSGDQNSCPQQNSSEESQVLLKQYIASTLTESSWSSKLRSFTIDTYGFLAISLGYLDVFPSTNLGRTWRYLSSTAGYPASTVAFASSPGEEKTSPYMSEQLFSQLEVMCSTSQTGEKTGENSRNQGRQLHQNRWDMEKGSASWVPMLPDSESVAIQQKCHRRLPLPKAVGSGDPSWGTPMGIQHLQRWWFEMTWEFRLV